MIIDESYFINDIAIANTNNTSIEASLNSAIVKREKEALISQFGYELYKLFIANPTDQIYLDIVEGKEFSFEFCGKTVTRKWIGLANSEKVSLLAYYVYFFYEKDRNTFNSSVGFVTPKVENAEQDNPRMNYVNSWNQYIEQRGDLNKINECPRTLNTRRYRPRGTYFNKFDVSTYEFLNDDPSLFNFLLANVATYPTWEFTPVKNINIFDL